MNNRTINTNHLLQGFGKRIKTLVAAGLCLSAMALVAAEKEKKKAEWDVSKLPPVASKTGLTFEKDINRSSKSPA